MRRPVAMTLVGLVACSPPSESSCPRGAVCTGDLVVTTLSGALSVAPSLVDLGLVGRGHEETLQLQLEAVRGEDVPLDSVELELIEGDGFSLVQPLPELVPASSAATAWRSVDLAFLGAAPGPALARVRVNAARPCSGHVEAVVRASVAAPDVGVHPWTLDFGAVPEGTYGVAALTLVNHGVTDSFVDLEIPAGQPFFLGNGASGWVGAGDTLQIEVRYGASDGLPAVGSLDLGELGTVELRANDCENGDPRKYDEDGDGTSSCGTQVEANGPWADGDGDGATAAEGDCSDDDPGVGPLVQETENGVDDDCDGVIDEGLDDLDGDGMSPEDGDCDDGDPWVRPGTSEFADGRDNDCDGQVDEDLGAIPSVACPFP